MTRILKHEENMSPPILQTHIIFLLLAELLIPFSSDCCARLRDTWLRKHQKNSTSYPTTDIFIHTACSLFCFVFLNSTSNCNKFFSCNYIPIIECTLATSRCVFGASTLLDFPVRTDCAKTLPCEQQNTHLLGKNDHTGPRKIIRYITAVMFPFFSSNVAISNNLYCKTHIN